MRINRNIKIELLEDKVIWENGWYPFNAFSSENSIIIRIGNNPIVDKNEESIIFTSDNGSSWSGCNYDEISMNHFVATKYINQSNGFVYGIYCKNVIQDKVKSDWVYKPFIMKIIRMKQSSDLINDIRTGNFYVDFVKVNIPELSGADGDDQNYTLGCAGQGLVEMGNGDLIMTMYGVFISDRTPIPYFPEGAFQYRTWVCISKDNGDSWSYLSTVASNDTCPLPEKAEGYCEADLLALDDRKLLCVMRTGGNPTGMGSMERYTPLVSSTSDDGGITWSIPEKIYDYGVYPRLLKMKNGIIVCLSGRPGFFMLLSSDDGKTWSESIEIATDAHKDFLNSPSGYSYIFENEKNVLSILYDDVVDEDNVIKHYIKMRKYKVEPVFKKGKQM